MRRYFLPLVFALASLLFTGCEAQKEQIEGSLEKAHKAADVANRRNAALDDQVRSMTDPAKDELDKAAEE